MGSLQGQPKGKGGRGGGTRVGRRPGERSRGEVVGLQSPDVLRVRSVESAPMRERPLTALPPRGLPAFRSASSTDRRGEAKPLLYARRRTRARTFTPVFLAAPRKASSETRSVFRRCDAASRHPAMSRGSCCVVAATPLLALYFKLLRRDRCDTVTRWEA